MASSMEKTFGSRLSNANKLATYLTEFTEYVPIHDTTSVANYKALLEDITSMNSNVSTTYSDFAAAADKRNRRFKVDEDCLLKRLTPISAYTKALFGAKSKEYTMVNNHMKKLRGQGTDHFKKDSESEWVSQSHQSYGSLIQNFANLINLLDTFGTSYTPPNESIKLPKLKELLDELKVCSHDVNQAYARYKTRQIARLEGYADLTQRSTRIKDTVKSIYGIRSTEYKLIKGLSI